jgi:hypothetical protein
MLGRIIDEMIDPVPAKRPQKAAHVAKSLRVFLAAEEHAREAKPEENIAVPAAVAAKVAEEEPVDEEVAGERLYRNSGAGITLAHQVQGFRSGGRIPTLVFAQRVAIVSCRAQPAPHQDRSQATHP